MTRGKVRRWRCYLVGYEQHAEHVDAVGLEEARAIIVQRLRIANRGLEHRQHLFEPEVICEPAPDGE